jgi:hypothetical protein
MGTMLLYSEIKTSRAKEVSEKAKAIAGQAATTLKIMRKRKASTKNYLAQRRVVWGPSPIIRVFRRSPKPQDGYSLVVALISGFVLLIGVGSLASRGNLGFIGQVFQTQNRQARDVAEAAIAEFANVMNQERNRHLLIAGTTANWSPSSWANPERDFRNVCTVFNDSFVASELDGIPVFVNPDATAVARFTPGGPPQALAAGDNARTFVVESIEFLNQQRQSYVNNLGEFLQFQNDPGPPPSFVSYGTLYRSGGERSLVRVTIRGQVTQNGRTSTSRVAREFEIVPKCCKRSFGRNVLGGTNWGRDEELCGARLTGKLSGITIGTNGASVGGSNNPKPILQEDGSPLTTASCFAGLLDPTQPSPLTGTANPNCGGDPPITRGAISFTPAKLNYTPPIYLNPDGAVAGPALNFSSSENYIYFDPSAVQPGPTPPRFSGVFLKQGNGTPTRIDNQGLASTQPDPCYVSETLNAASGIPYHTVNCAISGLTISGNRDLYVDTSAAKINLFTSGNVSVSGNASVARIHSYRSDLNAAPSQSGCISNNPSNCLIDWPSSDPGIATNRLNTFLELCEDRGGFNCQKIDGDELYSVRRLLNFYANGDQTFTLNGGSAGVGYNIYAPRGTITFNGGGNNENFMGQIFANEFNPSGNINIRTFGGGGGTITGGTPTGFAFGRPLVDFVARSFTQSSGFGF